MGKWRTHVLAAVLLVMVLGELPARGAFPGADGRIAFSRTGSQAEGDLYAIDADGSRLETVRADCGQDSQAEWGPGGSKIVYLNSGFTSDGSFRHAVMVSDPTGTAPRELGYGLYPSWSPDGAQIAFADAGGLAVMDADGSDRRVIYSDGDAFLRAVAWSPLGDRIAFVSGAIGEPGDIFTINPDGTGLTTLVASPDSEDEIDWSPDGLILAFTRRVGSGLADIYLVHSDGSKTRLTETPEISERSPAFSPDGTRIAYAEFGTSGPSRSIVITDAAGNKVDVPNTAGAFGVDWQAIPAASPTPASSPPTAAPTPQPQPSHPTATSTGGTGTPPTPSRSPCPGPSFPPCPQRALSTCAPPPRAARTVSLESTASRVRYGGGVTLSGRITSETAACVADQTVTIQRITPIPEQNLTTTQTGADGSFSATIAPQAAASYIARVDLGYNSNCESAESSSVSIEVAVAVRLRAVDASSLTRLIVSIQPCEGHAGTKVAIQRRGSAGFRTFARAGLNDACRARKTLHLTPGTYRARWRGQDEDHVAGVSRSIKVRA